MYVRATARCRTRVSRVGAPGEQIRLPRAEKSSAVQAVLKKLWLAPAT
jgi:hypothetical protein